MRSTRIFRLLACSVLLLALAVLAAHAKLARPAAADDEFLESVENVAKLHVNIVKRADAANNADDAMAVHVAADGQNVHVVAKDAPSTTVPTPPSPPMTADQNQREELSTISKGKRAHRWRMSRIVSNDQTIVETATFYPTAIPKKRDASTTVPSMNLLPANTPFTSDDSQPPPTPKSDKKLHKMQFRVPGKALVKAHQEHAKERLEDDEKPELIQGVVPVVRIVSGGETVVRTTSYSVTATAPPHRRKPNIDMLKRAGHNPSAGSGVTAKVRTAMPTAGSAGSGSTVAEIILGSQLTVKTSAAAEETDTPNVTVNRKAVGTTPAPVGTLVPPEAVVRNSAGVAPLRQDFQLYSNSNNNDQPTDSPTAAAAIPTGSTTSNLPPATEVLFTSIHNPHATHLARVVPPNYAAHPGKRDENAYAAHAFIGEVPRLDRRADFRLPPNSHANTVLLARAPAPLLRQPQSSSSVITSRKRKRDQQESEEVDANSKFISRKTGRPCNLSAETILTNSEVALEANRPGALFEMANLGVVFIGLFIAFTSCLKISSSADAFKKQKQQAKGGDVSSDRCARWSFSNGVVISQVVMRTLQLSAIAFAGVYRDAGFISTIFSYLAFGAESNSLIVLQSSIAPLMASSHLGKALLYPVLLFVAYFSTNGVIPTTFQLVKTLSCRYDIRSSPSAFLPNEESFCNVACWDDAHWNVAVKASVCLAIAAPLFVWSGHVWQQLDATLDIKYERWFITFVAVVNVLLSIFASYFAPDPATLSLIITLTSAIFALISFTTRISKVRWASDMVGLGYLFSGAAGILGLMSSSFWAEDALWWILLGIAWSALGAVGVVASGYYDAPFFITDYSSRKCGRLFTFEPEVEQGPSLKSRIIAAATSKDPIEPLTPPTCCPLTTICESIFCCAPIKTKTRVDLELRLIHWARQGTLNLATALELAASLEASDPILQIVYDRFTVRKSTTPVVGSDDRALTDALNALVKAKLLLVATTASGNGKIETVDSCVATTTTTTTKVVPDVQAPKYEDISGLGLRGDAVDDQTVPGSGSASSSTNAREKVPLLGREASLPEGLGDEMI
ncbi:hypothetical protein HDU76_012955 [Blyttiomyces sp. JEL0837]|nr:hypothetical protein HDU76_012955 [Blyttiomyces sp. JEL0837]